MDSSSSKTLKRFAGCGCDDKISPLGGKLFIFSAIMSRYSGVKYLTGPILSSTSGSDMNRAFRWL